MSNASTSTNQILLEVQDLYKYFGGVHALDCVNFEVTRGEVFAIIGPNGAGKTTLFNCLTGIERPTAGRIVFNGTPITRMSPHKIAEKGAARTWQTIQLFEHMTVIENVLVGRHSRGHCGIPGAVFRMPWHFKEEHRMKQAAFEKLRFLEIDRFADHSVAQLPFIIQRRVELARALASDPLLLLLDEPAAGLNTRETAELAELINKIRDEGVTILLVEHDMTLVMEISDRVLVLDHGVPIAEGVPRDIQEDEKVIAVYLGEDELEMKE